MVPFLMFATPEIGRRTPATGTPATGTGATGTRATRTQPTRAITVLDRKPLGVTFSIDIACVAVIEQMSQLMNQDVIEIEILD